MSALSVTNSDFTPNTPILSSQIDQNFADIIAWANGNIDQSNFDTLTGTVSWLNATTGASISVSQTGVLASATSAVKVTSSTAQTDGDALVFFRLSAALSTIPLLKLSNAGTGAALDITNSSTGAAVKVANDDAGTALDLINSSTGKYLQARTSTANYAELTDAGVLTYVGALSPGWMSNIGLKAATDTDTNDSICITSADGSDFSATNPGYICLPGTTAGTLAVFRITANVTIKLTGAHCGLGTFGDFSDIELRVYAINDDGALKFGVSNQGGYRTITTALSSQTQTDITTQAKMLVNSTLSGTSACHQVGWFLADFNDTGDIHTVQTGAGEIQVGVPVPTNTDPVSYTPVVSGLGTGSSTNTFVWRRIGSKMVIDFDILKDGSNGTGGANVGFTIPSQYKFEALTLGQTFVGVGQRSSALLGVILLPASSTTVVFLTTSGADMGNGSRTNGRAELKIRGWSAN